MKFDHGTLDSGERSLPLGLLVCKSIIVIVLVIRHDEIICLVYKKMTENTCFLKVQN